MGPLSSEYLVDFHLPAIEGLPHTARQLIGYSSPPVHVYATVSLDMTRCVKPLRH